MEIDLLRHGTAEEAEAAGGNDEARRLTSEGREQVILAARTLRRMGLRVDLAISSPLPRALETAELTAKALGCAGAVRKDDRLRPGADPQRLLRALQPAGDDQRVLLVGHNPDLEQFLAWLVSPNGDAALTLKKGGLAVVEVAGGKKALKRPGCGSLLALYSAKALARLAES
jgi:phosphohistidine phosphatase